MNPGDVVQLNGREHLVVLDLGEKIVVTSATPRLQTEVFAVPREDLFGVDPD